MGFGVSVCAKAVWRELTRRAEPVEGDSPRVVRHVHHERMEEGLAMNRLGFGLALIIGGIRKTCIRLSEQFCRMAACGRGDFRPP